MNLASSFIERFAEILSIFLYIYFIYRTLEPKHGLRFQIVAGAIFLCVRMAYYCLDLAYRPYFSLLIGMLYAYVVFHGQLQTYLLWSMIPVVLDGTADASVISLYLLLPNASPEQVESTGWARFLMIIVSKAILLLLYYWITKKIEKSSHIPWKDSLLLLAPPIGCWILLEVVFSYSDQLANKLSLPLLASGSVVLLLMMASAIALYNRITASQKELALSKLQLRSAKMTQDHIAQINGLYAQLSSVRHDLHNHFAVIGGLLRAKNYEDLEQYIKNITNIDLAPFKYTRHPVLNALIGAKMTLAKEMNIRFDTDVMLPKALPITDTDLCILIGNILDNAFEANINTTGARFIRLQARVVNSYWVVACHNSTATREAYQTASAIKSSKAEQSAHGVGTRQVQKIAEGAGGFVKFQQEEREFSVLAMIQLPDEPDEKEKKHAG